jgi:hypothetical protein
VKRDERVGGRLARVRRIWTGRAATLCTLQLARAVDSGERMAHPKSGMAQREGTLLALARRALAQRKAVRRATERQQDVSPLVPHAFAHSLGEATQLGVATHERTERLAHGGVLLPLQRRLRDELAEERAHLRDRRRWDGMGWDDMW